MARKTKDDDIESMRKMLDQYDEVFGEVDHFVRLIAKQEEEILAAQSAMFEAKAEYDRTKTELASARESRDGTKHALFVFLRPGPTEIMPLFDRMAPADEQKHGAKSKEWRKEPINALRLSLVATNLLTAADIMFVGQLQDLMLGDPEGWWQSVDGLGVAVAMAVADKLNEFINDRTTE